MSEHIVEKLFDEAYKAFQNNDLKTAKKFLYKVFFYDPMDIRAWWLTENNPEYMMTSKEFLKFVSDYCTDYCKNN